MSGHCYYHGPTDRELRPYGPGGSTICHPCMVETPEREEAAKGAFWALLEANAELSNGVVTIGGEEGPVPGA